MMTSMLQDVDDIASVVIHQPPTDPSQMVVLAKKVQMIIRRCMVSIGGTLGCTPSKHDIQQTFPVPLSRHRPWEDVPNRGARGVKRGARRQPGRGVGSGRPLVPPFPRRHELVDPGHIEVERGKGSRDGQTTIDPFDSSNLDTPSFSLGLAPSSQSLPSGSGTLQTPPPTSLGFASLQAPCSTSYDTIHSLPSKPFKPYKYIHSFFSSTKHLQHIQLISLNNPFILLQFPKFLTSSYFILLKHLQLNYFKIEAINHVRVMLFWDSEIAKDAYSPYFTGTIRKSWTLPTNRMISHAELVKKILKYRDWDPNI
ncbi:hypothetical protein M9H77_08749 [Catharanthus roseus]|uniref:Uncharacterized protein n=1 Tax=Catharanthus roseus TaxID=4058 RepID=A0ACC0BYV7_CATRO|nr:hypothetical protein M9H77_08749 [Catharanthus roseus]